MCTHDCKHLSIRVCIRMHTHTHTRTNSGAVPAQTTKSLKKKAFKRIVWLILLYPNKNIPESKKMSRIFFSEFSFPKISKEEVYSF